MVLFWAYVAGLLTLLNPCVLPLLPIVLASSLQHSRVGPLYLVAGLILSFTVIGVGVSAFGHLIGLDDVLVNRISAIIMIVFGLVLLVPRATDWVSKLATPFANRANTKLDQNNGVFKGQFFTGLLLGGVWSPCIGPTLGGAIGLAASGDGLFEATAVMVAFGFGIGTIILALSYGSQELLHSRKQGLMKIMPYAKPIMGTVLLLVGITILFHWERVIEGWLLDVMPIWLQELSIAV